MGRVGRDPGGGEWRVEGGDVGVAGLPACRAFAHPKRRRQRGCVGMEGRGPGGKDPHGVTRGYFRAYPYPYPQLAGHKPHGGYG
jgi:hypothetical protein